MGGTTTAIASSPIGPYPINPTVTGTNLGNYTVTYVPAILTVGPATLTVTAVNALRAYGAANPGFTGTYSGQIGSDSFTVGGTTTAIASSPIGPYPINPTVTGTNLGNYTVTYVPAILTVGPATLTVTAVNALRAYGAANPGFSGTYSGQIGTDSFTVGGTTTAIASSPIGPYPINPTVTGTNLGNYTVTYVPAILTVGPATLTVTAVNALRAYGAANPGFSGTYSGQIGTDSFTVGGTTTAIASSPIGPYPINPTVTGTNLGNYTVTYVPAILTVGPATLTVTAVNALRAYGAANPAFSGTYSGQIGTDSFTVGGTTTAIASSPIGPYPINPTVTGTNLGNYTVTYVPAILTVGPATLTVTAVNALRAYGAANPAFSGTYSGQIGTDSFTVGGTTTAIASSPIGPYPINPTVTGTNLGNYTITYVPAILTVGPATLTVTAVNALRAYGAANPGFSGTYSGQIGTDSFTVGGTTTAIASSPIGPYPINPTVTGTNLGNYTVTYVPAILTVGPATLTVTAVNALRAYGAANPAFSGTYSGQIGTDSFTVGGTTTAIASSPIGPYPINPTVTGTNLGNYTVTYVPAILTVGPATLTVTAVNALRAYGAANPGFSGSYSGQIGSGQLHGGGHDDGDRQLAHRTLPHQPDGDGHQPGQLHRHLRACDPDGRAGHPDGDGSQRSPRLRCGQPWVQRQLQRPDR